jgi:Fe2+ transport system protein FeoA
VIVDPDGFRRVLHGNRILLCGGSPPGIQKITLAIIRVLDIMKLGFNKAMSEDHSTLDRLDEHETAVIVGYDAKFPRARRERFEDLGLLPDTTVQRLHTAPFGDPIAFSIRETVLCLRREDARRIKVRSVIP